MIVDDVNVLGKLINLWAKLYIQVYSTHGLAWFTHEGSTGVNLLNCWAGQRMYSKETISATREKTLGNRIFHIPISLENYTNRHILLFPPFWWELQYITCIPISTRRYSDMSLPVCQIFTSLWILNWLRIHSQTAETFQNRESAR